MSDNSSRSNFGSFELVNAEQASHHPPRGGYSASGGNYQNTGVNFQQPGAGMSVANLPANVKYPPSYRQQQMYHTGSTHPTPSPPPHHHHKTNPATVATTLPHPPPPTSTTRGSSNPHNGSYSMSDIIQQLETAGEENMRLQRLLRENNSILQRKTQQIEEVLTSRDNEKHHLEHKIRELEDRAQKADTRARDAESKSMSLTEESQQPIDDPINKFFEARVAVMGFKCRVMQLQGELEASRKDLRKGIGDAPAKEETERLDRENHRLVQALKQVENERDAARKEASMGGGSSRKEKELQKHIQTLTVEVKTYELIAKEVQEQLDDKRHLFAAESKRMAHEKQQKQAQIDQLLREVQQLQHQLGEQQQRQEQQVTLLNAEVSRLRQSQSRINELSRELTMAQAEVHRYRGDLEKARQDAQKLEKQSAMFQSKLRENDGKMSAMEGKLKDPQKSSKQMPIPKPRSDIISQLKTEKTQIEKTNEELELRVATLSSELDREKRLRETVEREKMVDSEKIQNLLMKNSQLQKNLGISGSAGGGGGEGKEGVTREQVQGSSWGGDEQERLERRVREEEEERVKVEVGLKEKSQDLERLRMELDSIQREKRHLESQIERLEEDRKKAVSGKGELGTKLALLQEEVKTLREEGPQKMEQKTRVPNRLEKRLNEAVGKHKALEHQFEETKRAKTLAEDELKVLKKERDDLQEEKVEFTTMNQRLEEDKKSLEREKQRLEEDKDRLEGQTLRSIRERTDLVTLQLRERDTELVRQRLQAQRDVDELRANLSLQKENYERKINEKEEAVAALGRRLKEVQDSVAQQSREEIMQMQQESRVKEQQLAAKEQEVTGLTTQLQSLQRRYESVEANNTLITTHVNEAKAEKERLQKELNKTNKMAAGFKGECESLVHDYQAAGGQIKILEEERDRYKMQADMGLRELAIRAERIKTLETMRKGLEEQLQHMDFQLKQYMADFTSERAARESAIQVKDMAERKHKELISQVSALQQHITQQTAVHLPIDSEEPGEPPPQQNWSPSPPVAGVGAIAGGGGGGGGGGAVGGVGVGGGGEGGGGMRQTVWSGSSAGGSSVVPPNMWPGSPAGAGTSRPSLPPHSGEQRLSGPSHSPHSPGGRELEAAPPPLPPKPGPSEVYHTKPMLPNERGLHGMGGVHPHRPPPPPRQELVTGPTMPFMKTEYTQQGRSHRPAIVGVGGGAPLNNLNYTGDPTNPEPPPLQLRQGLPQQAPLPPSSSSSSRGGREWVAPGEVENKSAPSVGCPLCGRNDFPTVTDLEIHCAQCTGQ